MKSGRAVVHHKARARCYIGGEDEKQRELWVFVFFSHSFGPK